MNQDYHQKSDRVTPPIAVTTAVESSLLLILTDAIAPSPLGSVKRMGALYLAARGDATRESTK